ncbi:MAG: alpha-L-fucosidase [Acidobacteriaceae bacterium]|nr:alpha-L-fucosidase [Acidobacteriaceae bacterium]
MTTLVLATAGTSSQDRLTWWRDARFGMFIHWGLYSIPAGEWKGQQVPGIGEWIMNRAKIPVKEYEQLASQFNPVKFNADEWVKTAQEAGQKYMVITAKHHDGFAMFHSKVSKYNVYDATPFHRDVIGELAAACKRHGMPLGFYYSQTQDWHEKDAVGNIWDFDPKHANFDKYLHEKAMPQVRELLTNYGPVALIWFDTPRDITAAQSKELVDLVHKLQPNCLVDGRVGNDAGDYRSTGDNEIPSKRMNYDWEVPATLNDTWGFKKNDSNWKSPQTLIRQLVDIVSKNGNYLLNVGPTSEGLIPQPSVERLQAVGAWLKTNGDAVYAAKPSPFPYEFNWGSITTKENRLFLNVVEWPKDGRFTLYGLQTGVQRASLLARPEDVVTVAKDKTSGTPPVLNLKLPAHAPDPNVSVVAVDLDGPPKANQELIQQPDGSVTLNGQFADLPSGTPIKISNRGITSNWTDPSQKLEWTFEVYRPGRYQVIARTTPVKSAGGWDTAQWSGGDELQASVEGHNVSHTLSDEGKIPDPRNPLYPDVKTTLGEVTLSPGTKRLTVQATKINPETKGGIHLREIELIPMS